MAKYAVWNKKDNVLTPIGELLTAEQWITRHPIAGIDNITVVCAAGEINGAFFGTLGQMVDMYESLGADFSACTTAEEKLAIIEAFEKQKNEEQLNTISNEELTATSLASIAASMEYQNLLTFEDAEVE